MRRTDLASLPLGRTASPLSSCSGPQYKSAAMALRPSLSFLGTRTKQLHLLQARPFQFVATHLRLSQPIFVGNQRPEHASSRCASFLASTAPADTLRTRISRSATNARPCARHPRPTPRPWRTQAAAPGAAARSRARRSSPADDPTASRSPPSLPNSGICRFPPSLLLPRRNLRQTIPLPRRNRHSNLSLQDKSRKPTRSPQGQLTYGRARRSLRLRLRLLHLAARVRVLLPAPLLRPPGSSQRAHPSPARATGAFPRLNYVLCLP